MKAVVAAKPENGPSVSLETSREQPKPGPNEVLVKVTASPIQPSDFLSVSGGFPANTTFPRVPGRDFAGIVVEPQSSPLHGKLVHGTSGPTLGFTQDGAHAEFVLVSSDAVAEVAKSLDAKQASSLGTPWTTAYLAMKRSGVRKGEVVAVIGAGGAVGNAAIQIAKSSLYGATALRIGRSDKYDVNSTTDPKLAKIKELTGGKGADVVFDTTGDLDLTNAAYDQLAQGGRLTIITTGPSRGANLMSINLKDLYRLEHSLVGCNSVAQDPREMAAWLKELSTLFDAGELQAPDVSGYESITLDKAAEAYEELSKGKHKKFMIVSE